MEERELGKTPHDGFDFHVTEADVEDYADFGAFEILKFKKGMMYRDYTGYHIWVEPYVVGPHGKASKTTLYQWLETAMANRNNLKDAPEKPFADDFTCGELLDYEKIITEATLEWPKMAFVDINMAGLFAHLYIKWLDAYQKKLALAMSEAAPDDYAMEVEEKARLEYAEQSEKFLTEMQNVLEKLTSDDGEKQA